MRVHQTDYWQWLLLLILLYRLGANATKGKQPGVSGRKEGIRSFFEHDLPRTHQGNTTRRMYAGRVIGGRLAERKKFPFVVSIQLIRNKAWMHHCGGSIISATAILTACHCVVVGIHWDPPVLLDPSVARVVAGVVNLDVKSREKQVRRVLRVEAHPRCSNKPYYLSYDVGVYILREPLRYTVNVQPLKVVSGCADEALRALSSLARKGAICFSPGWGTTKSPGYYPSNIMKVATLQLFTTKQCQRFFCERTKHYCDIDYYKAKQICAAGSDSSDCNGDSGGPLVCKGFIFGTVSWRIRCDFGWPHVFTNIVPVMDMVKKYSCSYNASKLQHDDEWYR